MKDGGAPDGADRAGVRESTDPDAAGASSRTAGLESAVLAGGCFWCLEAVFEEVVGVSRVKSGYAGGTTANPSYEEVCSGTTGHAEAVKVDFDPAAIGFRELLDVFFGIHDPTTLDRQGADVGTQYRSAIFYDSANQRQVAREALADLERSGIWDDPVTTRIEPLVRFHPAEERHDRYFARNRFQPYCALVVAPKVAAFRRRFAHRIRPKTDRPRSRPLSVGVLAAALAGSVLWSFACGGTPEAGDTLILGGSVIDGSGGEPVLADVMVSGDRIAFVGEAGAAGVTARDTVDAVGDLVVPGFIDMHSHAELDADHGRDAKAFLHQGITSVALGVDGFGPPEVAQRLGAWQDRGIGVNAFAFVGHNAVRARVVGMEDRAPDPEELATMRALVRQGMEEGAYGLSSGLFYLPGNYAATEEVIELNRVAAEFDGAIYDTHDRDLGAAYPPFGYLRSIEEGIRIGEEAGTKVVFSHFNAQGAHNYGRAPEGAALIEQARARGVEVAGAHHSYTATQSNLRSYTVPGWAAEGGEEAMLRRFDDPDTAKLIDAQTREMLAIRGGADSIMFVDERPELNGRTLGELAREWGMEAPEAARRVLRDGNAAVMNHGLYDPANIRYLAGLDWMMTCTDGRDPGPSRPITHPRAFGSFTKKLRELVLEDGVIEMSFAVRSMTGLAADFLGWRDRGYLREGYFADVAVLDVEELSDEATYEDPRRFSKGTRQLLVNGRFAIRDGLPTGELAGRALTRGGGEFGDQGSSE